MSLTFLPFVIVRVQKEFSSGISGTVNKIFYTKFFESGNE